MRFTWQRCQTAKSIRCQHKKSLTKMASTSAALEGLPKQFVVAMKTLFEIMDDKKTGFVKLTGWFVYSFCPLL